MKFGTVADGYIRQLEVNHLSLIGNPQAYFILSGEVPEGVNQFMQIGYITILVTGLGDVYYQSATFG